MFMRYVHTEDEPVRAAAEAVTRRRLNVIGVEHQPPAPPSPPVIEPPSIAPVGGSAPAILGPDGKPLGFEDGKYASRTRVGNYRPFRHRSGENRTLPPGSKRSEPEVADHA
jgi:hypothetical protein